MFVRAIILDYEIFLSNAMILGIGIEMRKCQLMMRMRQHRLHGTECAVGLLNVIKVYK